jgi:hypothetical protein
MGQEKGDIFMSYSNSVTIVGFVGADPEQRQARNNGSKFTVLCVARQRSWKNAGLRRQHSSLSGRVVGNSEVMAEVALGPGKRRISNEVGRGKSFFLPCWPLPGTPVR